MKIGETLSWSRAFTEGDIRLFAKLSGDQGSHHLQPDEQGRLMAHGLLTATLPTKIGGDINFIAREMTFAFHRPVFAGDTITCEVTLTALEPAENYSRVSSTWVCRNQDGKDVMTGEAKGVIRNSTS
ncbi:MAG TPA: enoyl-CoA hydratase [Blastocatellia bacterium]|jgi:acyl dehydratase|nr:enoyl-CoA hydratase [Blastocatellia bacterium]HAF22023.1 enoyl-CoA hydratase [Blastocatellia bacterium]HCX31929.1 enoyl-CoA hydratase [Blastocatellia bacterium]